MQEMIYAGVNLGEQDVFYANAKPGALPFLSSNIVYKKDGAHVGKPYIILEKNGNKIAVTGISPGGSERHISFNQTFKVIKPGEALKPILEEIRSRVDLIVLLSLYTYTETQSILNVTEGIDIAISQRQLAHEITSDPKPDNLLEFGQYCTSIEWAKISLDPAGGIKSVKKHHMKLNNAIEPDLKIAQYTDEATFNDLIKQMDKEKKKRIEKEVKALHKLSPQEYMELISKQKLNE